VIQKQGRPGKRRQSDHRQRLDSSRQTAENTNIMVFWWGIIQLVMLIVIGGWQITNLRQFFVEKKLA